MSSALGKPFDEALDGENNAVEFDIAYPLRGSLPGALDEIRRRHGKDIYLLPMSGTSSGGGIFQPTYRPPGSVIGIRFDAPAQPRVRVTEIPRLDKVELDEILIDPAQGLVAAGAAVTLDQLNRALIGELGPACRVPGADLTSYQYAAVGATFMTGGMGPQRRYFSDSVIEAAIHDGNTVACVSGDALTGYAGTYGWSGLVGAVRCRYYPFPVDEIAFALPVSDRADELARLLQRLAPYCKLHFNAAGAGSAAGAGDLILGAEHVSAASMQPLLNDTAENAVVSRGRDLQRKCRAAGAEGLIFVSGLSDRPVDEFLADLCDRPEADEPTLAGIRLEHAELFGDAEEMRILREAIPYAARMQKPAGRFVYKNHTDANIRIETARTGDCVQRLWQINRDYVAAVESRFADDPGSSCEILVYGHLNPYGFDPHNRVTMSCDDATTFTKNREQLVELRAAYYRELAGLCARGDAQFVGGEKTADSEIAIFRALGGPGHAPAALRARFERQRETIAGASSMFNWRAPEPYA